MAEGGGILPQWIELEYLLNWGEWGWLHNYQYVFFILKRCRYFLKVTIPSPTWSFIVTKLMVLKKKTTFNEMFSQVKVRQVNDIST